MKLKTILSVAFILCLLYTSACSDPNNTTLKSPKDNLIVPISNPTPSSVTPSSVTPQQSTDLETTPPPSEVAPEIIGDDLPIQRALAAKMSALALSDIYSIDGYDSEISFADCNDSDWYYKFVNAAVILGLMPQEDTEFRPNDNLSIIEAQNILNAINPENSVKMKITDENKHMPISYALWVQLYEKCLTEQGDLSDTFDINEKNLVVLGDNANNSKLLKGHIITDNGPYTAYGIDMGIYIDKEIRVLLKDGEVLAVLNVESTNPVLKGAYVVSHEENQLKIFLGGAERIFGVDFTEPIPPTSIVSFTLNGGYAENINVLTQGITGTVKLHNQEHVELVGETLPLSKDFRVYALQQGLITWKRQKNIIVGSDTTKFYRYNGEIIAAVIESNPSPKTIRVAIKDSDFESFIHSRIEINGTGEFSVSTSNGQQIFKAGESYIVESTENIPSRVYITPISGRLAIESIQRAQGTPVYRGTLEILPKDGGFIIVNELPTEEYLYSVVPSEMPVSYGLEAQKVQAVTARSYACNQYYSNNFHQYGANVCDSVISQVYNNIEETEDSIKAVDETNGLCLKYNGAVISANFFSTSCGVTANSGEVWAEGVTKRFPTSTSDFLTSKSQNLSADYGDLSIEENMAKFIKANDIAAYDSFSNWFRWYVEMTSEEISASINNNLTARYEAAPKLIKTLQPDGIFRSRPVSSIGQLKNIEITKRGEAGNIMAMKITGSENTILVSTEYNIRTLIRPVQYDKEKASINIFLSDDKIRENYNIMPSAFYAMERMTDTAGNLLYVKFYGGGNGHGVGMSQTGVKGMVDMGKTFEEILNHFYDGTVIEKIW